LKPPNEKPMIGESIVPLLYSSYALTIRPESVEERIVLEVIA